MKALTVFAPQADAIANGLKIIECRTWQTSYRGPLLICSSAQNKAEWGDMFVIGHAVALTSILSVEKFTKACLENACMDAMPTKSSFAWMLSQGLPIEPFPVKGKSRLFDVDCLPVVLEDKYLDEEELLNYWFENGFISKVS